MKLATSYQSAKELADRSEPLFYSHLAAQLHEEAEDGDIARHVIGRRYRGLFDGDDGSHVTLTRGRAGETLIDRDAFGAIPIFYSTRPAIVSTDIRTIVRLLKPSFDSQAVAEYLSATYPSGGNTVFRNVRFLMPDERLVVKDGAATANPKRSFPEQIDIPAQEAARLLERAIDNSIDDLLKRYPGGIVLNLSGGADSTLLLAKIRERDRNKGISTTTYFHEDWREDIDDWRYADEAAATFASHHRLIRLSNESFCRAHAALLERSSNVSHTYAAAFYAQNELAAALDRCIPIVNGSGPDESIVGTEKLSIDDLLSLRDLRREQWIDHLIGSIEYFKIPEACAAAMVLGEGHGFSRARRDIAARLLDAPNFVEFQRRYHAITMLQDHIQELSAAAQALDRVIAFPYLTDDIFRIVFSVPFATLNAGGVYKAVVKSILEKYMPRSFVHRRKIGFQSPSRPYFKSERGLGRELARLLAKGDSTVLDLGVVRPAIRERLGADLDLRRRYDFLEWTAYNILLLEEHLGSHA